jgi:hypothetical protein
MKFETGGHWKSQIPTEHWTNKAVTRAVLFAHNRRSQKLKNRISHVTVYGHYKIGIRPQVLLTCKNTTGTGGCFGLIFENGN